MLLYDRASLHVPLVFLTIVLDDVNRIRQLSLHPLALDPRLTVIRHHLSIWVFLHELGLVDTLLPEKAITVGSLDHQNVGWFFHVASLCYRCAISVYAHLAVFSALHPVAREQHLSLWHHTFSSLSSKEPEVSAGTSFVCSLCMMSVNELYLWATGFVDRPWQSVDEGAVNAAKAIVHHLGVGFPCTVDQPFINAWDDGQRWAAVHIQGQLTAEELRGIGAEFLRKADELEQK